MSVCYFLTNETGRRSYIGATVDLKRRLRQHRGEIKGGARSTKRWKKVKLVAHIEGFVAFNKALSYEMKAKKCKKRFPRLSKAHHYRLAQFLYPFTQFDGLTFVSDDASLLRAVSDQYPAYSVRSCDLIILIN